MKWFLVWRPQFSCISLCPNYFSYFKSPSSLKQKIPQINQNPQRLIKKTIMTNNRKRMTQVFHVFSNKLYFYLWKAHFFIFSPCLCMHPHTSFVSIQSCELNLLEKLHKIFANKAPFPSNESKRTDLSQALNFTVFSGFS